GKDDLANGLEGFLSAILGVVSHADYWLCGGSGGSDDRRGPVVAAFLFGGGLVLVFGGAGTGDWAGASGQPIHRRPLYLHFLDRHLYHGCLGIERDCCAPAEGWPCG